MGFEQLAALRDQLASAAQEKNRETTAKAGRGAKNGGPKPVKPSGGKPTPAPSQKKAAPKKAPAKPQPDVDPVVLVISRLQRKFPVAFPKKPAPKVPLKLGVHDDLQAQAETLGLNADEIKSAIQTWCQGSRYWACMKVGAPRINLAGEPQGEVTAPEAARARQLARRQHAKKAPAKPAESQPASTDAVEAAIPASENDLVASAASADVSSTVPAQTPSATEAPAPADTSPTSTDSPTPADAKP